MEKEWETQFRQIIEAESRTIAKMGETLNYEVLDQILRLFCRTKEQGGKMIFAGCGTAGMAAKRIAHTLNVVELPAFFLSPADAVHGGLGAVQKGDVLVLISKSGNTAAILDYIPAAKEKGAVIIAVTGDGKSLLAAGSDLVLKIETGREPDQWGMISSASTLAFISAFDAIAFMSMKITHYTKEQFYLIHTGGGVGDILRKEGIGGEHGDFTGYCQFGRD